MKAGRSDIIEKKVQGKTYLFGIGINKYIEFPPIYNAVKDIQDISNILFNNYQFKEEEAIFLFDAEATKENIYANFRNIIQKITKDDSILIYYSGHGEYDEITNQGYWIPFDATKSHSSFIEDATILSFINAMKARHVVIISDASFSGSLLIKNVR